MEAVRPARRGSAAVDQVAGTDWVAADADRRSVSMKLAGRTSEVLPEDLEPVHDSWDSFLLSWKVKFHVGLTVFSPLLEHKVSQVTANLTPYRHTYDRAENPIVVFKNGPIHLDEAIAELDRNTADHVKIIVIIVPSTVKFGVRASNVPGRIIMLQWPPLK